MAKYFQPSNLLGQYYESTGYSHAVVLPPNTQLVIAAGQPGVNSNTGEMVADPAQQIETCFDNCDAALKAAGVTDGLWSAHKVHCYFVDTTHEPIAMEIWRRKYPTHRPTFMALGVSKFVAPRMLVEIQVEAHVVLSGAKL